MISTDRLIEMFRRALNDHWGYIWGTAGEQWTEAKQKVLEQTTEQQAREHLTVEGMTVEPPRIGGIIEAVGERLNFPEEKVLVNIQNRGNTSAASIPLCLDENKHLIKKGDKLILTAFGAGFTWGAMYIIWSL